MRLFFGSTVVALVILTSPALADMDCIDFESYTHRLGTSRSYNGNGNTLVNLTVSESIALGYDEWGNWSWIDVSTPDEFGFFASGPMSGGFPVSAPAHIAPFPPGIFPEDNAFMLTDFARIRFGTVSAGIWTEWGETGFSGLTVASKFTKAPELLHVITDEPAYHSWFSGDRVLLASAPIALDADGSLAYVLLDNGELVILDATNREAPVSLSTFLLPSSRDQIFVFDGYAYLSSTSNPWAGIDIIDCTDPAAPSYLRNWDIRAQDVTADDRYLYVYGGIYDVSDPMAPVRLGDVTKLLASAVGNGRFVTPNYQGASVSDVSSPHSPQPVATVPATFDGDVCGDGTRLGLRRNDDTELSDLQFYDITDPDLPVPAGELEMEAGSFQIQGATAYVRSGDDLVLFDIADIYNPTQVGVVTVGGPSFRGMKVVGAMVALATPSRQLVLVDTSVPTSPVATATLANVRAFTLTRDYLLVVHSGDTVLYDVSDLNSLDKMGSIENQVNIENSDGLRVSVVGNLGFIQRGRQEHHGSSSATWTLDLTDPTQPDFVGFHDPLDWEFTAVDLPTAYTDYGIYTLEGIHDVRRIGDFPNAGFGNSLRLVGERLYRVNPSTIELESWLPQCNKVSSVAGSFEFATGSVAWPNPVRTDGAVFFSAPSEGPFEVLVSDVSGRKIRRLGASSHWDLRNEAGEAVAAGVYLVELRRDGNRISSGRLVVTR